MALLWIALLVVASSHQGTGPSKNDIPYADKVLHFVFFAGGAAAFGLIGRIVLRAGWPTIFVVCVLLMATFGFLDEWHQLTVPGRSGGDYKDWLADVAGAIAGIVILRHFLSPQSDNQEVTSKA